MAAPHRKNQHDGTARGDYRCTVVDDDYCLVDESNFSSAQAALHERASDGGTVTVADAFARLGLGGGPGSPASTDSGSTVGWARGQTSELVAFATGGSAVPGTALTSHNLALCRRPPVRWTQAEGRNSFHWGAVETAGEMDVSDSIFLEKRSKSSYLSSASEAVGRGFVLVPAAYNEMDQLVCGTGGWSEDEMPAPQTWGQGGLVL